MIYRFSSCEVDVLSGELRRGGRLVAIQAKPFLLLVYLIRNRDRLVEYDEILDELWHGTVVGDAAPRRAMKVLRRAIGDDGVSQHLLRTVRGRGYRFVGDVRVDEHARPEPPAWTVDPKAGGFVGRDRLMATVDAALARLEAGSGGLLLLTGEGGIGKTRALSEISQHAATRQVEVHRGVCVEGEGTPSFWPWSQVLRSVLESRGHERAHALVGAALSDLADIDPELPAGVASLEAAPRIAGADSSFRLRESVSRLLAALARERAMLIELDDLHWSDLGSLKLLIHLTRDLGNAPLLIVGTFRDFEAGLDRHRLELLGELERLVPGATIALSALDAGDVERLVAERIGEDVPRELLRSLLDRSGGNPFFVKQLLGLIRQHDGRLELESLADHRSAGRVEAIRLHAARLSDETLDVLRLAAVIGRRFNHGALFLALGRDARALSRALSEALRAGVIREEPNRVKSYSFVHALVAEALHESSDREWRAEAHAAIGTVLEQLADSMLGSREAEIAHHFVEAGQGYEEKAVAYGRRAGLRADERASSHEAVMQFERAVQVLEGLTGHQDTLCEVLIELGEARTRANDTVGGRESLHSAADLSRRLDRPDLFARAAVSYSNEIAIGALQPESIELLEEAVEWVRGDGGRRSASGGADSKLALEARLLSRLAYARFYIDTPLRRAERAEEAVEMAARSGDQRAEALTLKDYHHCMMGAVPARDRLVVTDRLAQLAKSLGDHELSAWCEKFRIEDAMELGESAWVDRCCDMQETIADDLRQPLFRCHSLHHRAMRAHRGGSLADAEAAADQGLQLGLRSGHQIAVQFYGVQLWSLRRDQGRLEELEPQVRSMIQSFPEDSGWRAALAYDYMERGDHEGAASYMVPLVDRERESVRSSVNWTTTPALLAEVACRLGDEARARLLYEELEPHRGGHVIVSLSMADFGPVERYLGLCAATFDPALAERHLRLALEACESARLLPVAASIRLDLARILHERNRDAAVELAGRARADAAALGLARVERAAEGFVTKV